MTNTQIDPVDQLKQDCGYAEVAEDGNDGGIDALIAYKNALEDRCRSIEADLAEAYGPAEKPVNAADLVETVGALLARYEVPLPSQEAI